MSQLMELIAELCPYGVEIKTIKELSSYRRGSFPQPYGKSEWYDGEGAMPFVQVADIGDDMRLVDNTNRKISLIAQPKSVFAPKGSIIISLQGSIGRIAITQYDAYIDRTVAIFQDISEELLPKYFVYQLQRIFAIKKKTARGSTIKTITKEEFTEFPIPVPPLPVQSEIVRILDNFTELTTELTTELATELTARKKQYEYYRDMLLSYEEKDNVTIKTIGELSSYRRGSFPQPYGKSEWYDGEGAMPFVQVADIGDDMRLVDNTKRKISMLAQPKSVFAPIGSVIISLQGSIGKIAVTQYNAYIDRTVAIFKNISSDLLPKYFVYQLQRIFAIKEKTARGSTIKTITKEEFTDFPIAVPELTEQERIVSILDRLDALCNDISIGLTAEIEARKNQFEYYRDKLLTFKELS
ncbi:restriction endonuclease subunit S [Fredinandcohnia humi]